jgi:hypothetical protein
LITVSNECVQFEKMENETENSWLLKRKKEKQTIFGLLLTKDSLTRGLNID